VTDGQTDGQTEFSSLYRVCITCSAVKMHKLLITILLLIVQQLTCFNTECYCQPFVITVLVGTSLICFTVTLSFKFYFKLIILLLDVIHLHTKF